jgi:hypothetical protein
MDTQKEAFAMVKDLLETLANRPGFSVRLGAKSRNAYARYKRGTSVPTVEKLSELLHAVAPGQDIVLRQSVVA